MFVELPVGERDPRVVLAEVSRQTSERKRDGSLVTIADRQTEQFMRQRILDRFPEDGIVGEEFGIRSGASNRTTSFTVLLISEGSSRRVCHCSGCVANRYSALEMALMVVSSDGAM